MGNPKIRIESDGKCTEIYIDGVKVKKATLCTMSFLAVPNLAECSIEAFKLNENGVPYVENDTVPKEIVFQMVNGKIALDYRSE